MKTFYIEITETRKTVVPVEAETEKEAVLKALMQYKKGGSKSRQSSARTFYYGGRKIE